MNGSAQDLVDDWYAEYRTPTVVVDTSARLIAFSAQPKDVIDGVRRDGLIDRNRQGISAYDWLVTHVGRGDTLIRTPPNPMLHLAARTIVPLYGRGVVVAYLMAVDPDMLITAEYVDQWQPVLAVTALEILFERTESVRRRTAVSALLGAVEDDRRQAADALVARYSLDNRHAVRVAVARILDDREGIFVDRRWELTGMNGIVAKIEHNLIAVLPDNSAVVEKFCDLVLRVSTFPRHTPRIGIGASVAGLDQAYRSYQQGKRTLNLATLLQRSDPVLRWDQLGSWRALLLLRPGDAVDAIDPRVTAMITAEDRNTVALVRDYLERDGDVAALATAQHIHRTTIYGRLKKLAAAYDVDWNSADDRMAILIGIRIAALHGLYGFSSIPLQG